jgi:hypothetical protein
MTWCLNRHDLILQYSEWSSTVQGKLPKCCLESTVRHNSTSRKVQLQCQKNSIYLDRWCLNRHDLIIIYWKFYTTPGRFSLCLATNWTCTACFRYWWNSVSDLPIDFTLRRWILPLHIWRNFWWNRTLIYS